MNAPVIDQSKLQSFVMQAVGDLAMSAVATATRPC